MKKIDSTEEYHSLNDVLARAKSEVVLIHSPTGEDFVLEAPDEFDREVAVLAAARSLHFSRMPGPRRREVCPCERYAHREVCELVRTAE